MEIKPLEEMTEAELRSEIKRIMSKVPAPADRLWALKEMEACQDMLEKRGWKRMMKMDEAPRILQLLKSYNLDYWNASEEGDLNKVATITTSRELSDKEKKEIETSGSYYGGPSGFIFKVNTRLKRNLPNEK